MGRAGGGGGEVLEAGSTRRKAESCGALSLGNLRGSFLGMGRVVKNQVSPELSSGVFMVFFKGKGGTPVFWERYDIQVSPQLSSERSNGGKGIIFPFYFMHLHIFLN